MQNMTLSVLIEIGLKFLYYVKSPGGNLPPSQKAFSYNFRAGMMTYFGQDRWHG